MANALAQHNPNAPINFEYSSGMFKSFEATSGHENARDLRPPPFRGDLGDLRLDRFASPTLALEKSRAARPLDQGHSFSTPMITPPTPMVTPKDQRMKLSMRC